LPTFSVTTSIIMAPKLFKDFNKDTKDLLTKQFVAAGEWKFESKIKPEDSTFILNPGFEAKGAKAPVVTVDVDYNVKELGLKTKTTLYNQGSIKPKVTYEKGCLKAELTVDNIVAAADSAVELTLEGVCPLTGSSLFSKTTKKATEGQISYAAGPITVGAGVVVGFGKGLEKWSAGARGTYQGFIVNVTTAQLKTYTTGVYAPVKIGDFNVKVGAQVDCGHEQFNLTAGLETAFKDVTIKAKATQACDVTVALVRKFADKYTAAVTLNLASIPKFGLTLTRE